MQTLRRTPLYERHAALGARLVPFAGWEMPVQYTSIVAEHRAVRTSAGVFDVSHMGELRLQGDGAHAYLQSRLAYRIQELAYGGLKPETRAPLEALGQQLDGGNVVLRRIRTDCRPLPGTRLVREYDGVQHVVTVRPDDFEFEGRRYASLSAIARHITGTRWNGWAFFGLKGRAP